MKKFSLVILIVAFLPWRSPYAQVPGKVNTSDSLHVSKIKAGIELSSLQLLVAWLGLPPLSLPSDGYSFTIPVAALPVEMRVSKNISYFLSPTYTVSGAGVGHNTPGVDSRVFINYLGLSGGVRIGNIIRLGTAILCPKMTLSSNYPDWISSVNSTYSRKMYVGLMASIGFTIESFYAGLQLNDRLAPDPGGTFLPKYYLSLGVGYFFFSVK